MLWTSICHACHGYGLRTTSRRVEGCDMCNLTGLVHPSTYPYDVTQARLCEVCGARAFAERCTAPSVWHNAHLEYTQTVRAGRVYVGWNIVPPTIWKGYDVTPFWRYPPAQRRIDADPYYISLSIDELEDAHYKLQHRSRRSKRHALEVTLQAYRFVAEGLPWWLAQTKAKIETLPKRDDIIPAATAYVEVNGYSVQRVDGRVEAPMPIDLPSFSRADFGFHQKPPHLWLRTAWERGLVTHYPEAKYRGLLRL